MSDVTSALKSLEDQIGISAQTGTMFPVPIPNLTKKLIISWLTIKGVWNASHCSDDTLNKLYNIPRYLEVTLENQKTGKNKYAPRTKGSLSFDSSSSEDDVISHYPETRNLTDDIISEPSLEPSSDQKLIEKLVRETIFHAITKEITDQRKVQEESNKKFQDSLIKTVHKNLQTVLTKSLEANRKLATDIAQEITETKIKNENHNLKGLVEDIIFKSYLNHKINNQTPEPQNPETPAHIANNFSTNNSFIPILDPNYHFDPYATRVIRSALSLSENLYVYGDTGCGKTTHLEQVCGVLGKSLIRINPHDGITREMFLGSMKLINNETIFVPGALPLAMRNGYVFLVDEISFLPPNLTAILNPIGEKGGKLYIPETSEWITPTPGFCIFATDNTGGKGDRTGNYTGTEVQNTATLDRFAFCLKMDYLPRDKEEEMLALRFPNITKNEIEKISSLAQDIRSAFSRGELSLTFSTRKLIKFFSQRENGFTIPETLSNTILSWLDEDDETLVKTMIDRLDLLNLPSTSMSF